MFIVNDFLRLFLKHWVKLSFLSAVAVWSVILAWPGTTVQVIFCDAGQGDETLIQKGFSQILIDASRPGRALDCLSRHMPFFDRTIDVLLITHPQLDHFGGANDVIDRYKLMRYVYNGFGSESPEWMQISEKLIEKKVPISVVSAGDEIKMEEVKLKALWPKSFKGPTLSTQGRTLSSGVVLGLHSPRDPNADAIVLAMTYGKFNALFTADIGEEEEKEILERLEGQQVRRLENSNSDDLLAFQPFSLSSISVLKVAHHGSKTSSSKAFLDAIRPLLAIIEVGKNNYGHPTKETIDRLKDAGSRVFRTDQDGDVVVETDGTKWKMKVEK